MEGRFDAIVLGVGAMGSAACYHLARRGLKVLGIEQFEIGHDRGSSHGRSRVIRKAYFEDPRYVPLLHSAYRMWQELSEQQGGGLIHLTGCLNLGPADHVCVAGARRSATEHELPFEALDCAEVKRRWPALSPDADDVGIFETDAGFLRPEACIAAHVEAATRRGCRFETSCRVVAWKAGGSAVLVETERGRFECGRLVITAGPWLPQIVSVLGAPLRIERQVQAWFRPTAPGLVERGRLPVFIHFIGDRAFYCIPSFDESGLKAARHHGGAITTPEEVDRTIHPGDEAEVRAYLANHLPSANGPMIGAEVCLYTNTPDEHFIIDWHPEHRGVLLAGGFSGHGFKFSPVVGQALSELAVDGRTPQPIEFLSLRRFTA